MLELDQDLPDGALLQSNQSDFEAAITASEALWFKGRWDAFATDDATGAVTAWQSTNGAKTAKPAEPNTGNGLLAEIDDRSGLRCMPEVNCGLVVPEVTGAAGTFTMAVIYKPAEDGQSKTLLTVNTSYAGGPEHDSNYLFLSDAGDFFTVKDVRGAVEIAAPVTSSPDGFRMAVVTLSGDTLAFAENLTAPTVMQGADAGMRTGADLFIGCRSHRGGLKKTLGGATILDVFFWPKHALLTPRTPADEAAYVALKRYFLWEY